jgi:hypothetical protein
MSKQIPTDTELQDQVRAVLKRVKPNKDGVLPYLTAYQILAQLPPVTQRSLRRQYGTGGKGSGNEFPDVTPVSKAADVVVGRGVVWLQTRGLLFGKPNGVGQEAGARVCRLYRLPD